MVQDCQQVYGVNLYDPVLLASPWPRVRLLILGLINQPSRLSRALHKEETNYGSEGGGT